MVSTLQTPPVAPATGRIVKLDQAFKIILRANRKSLRLLFELLGFGIGKHHWNTKRWLDEVTTFS